MSKKQGKGKRNKKEQRRTKTKRKSAEMSHTRSPFEELKFNASQRQETNGKK